MLRRSIQTVMENVVVRSAFTQGSRAMSMEGSKAFKDREEVAEKMYFNKEEERVVRKLASKMRAELAQHDADEYAKVVKAEKEALNKIVGKYKIHEKDIELLMDWKHRSF